MIDPAKTNRALMALVLELSVDLMRKEGFPEAIFAENTWRKGVRAGAQEYTGSVAALEDALEAIKGAADVEEAKAIAHHALTKYLDATRLPDDIVPPSDEASNAE